VESNVLAGVVKQATYLGNTVDYRVQVAEGLELRVQASSGQRHVPGDRVCLHLPMERCHLISEE